MQVHVSYAPAIFSLLVLLLLVVMIAIVVGLLIGLLIFLWRMSRRKGGGEALGGGPVKPQ